MGLGREARGTCARPATSRDNQRVSGRQVLEQETAQLQDAVRTTTAELTAVKRERDTAFANLEGTQLALRQTMHHT